MAPITKKTLIKIFPKLHQERFEVTSPEDPKYNCIAWAAGETSRWWEPDPMGQCYWPQSARREYTVEAYEDALRSSEAFPLVAADGKKKTGKLAIFTQGERPTHAARQLDDGAWTSKLGQSVDIRHSLEDLSGEFYGEIARIVDFNEEEGG